MACSAELSARFRMLVALLALLSTTTQLVLAQSSTTSAGAAVATIYPGDAKWEYHGCYNETTLTNGTGGLRALNGGIQETREDLDAAMCLSYCQSNSFAFAGLEYSKECWCAPYLSSISQKLPDESCDLACVGNSTQICGGALKLTVYEAKKSTKGSSIKGVREAPVGSILALGIAMGVLLCLA